MEQLLLCDRVDLISVELCAEFVSHVICAEFELWPYKAVFCERGFAGLRVFKP